MHFPRPVNRILLPAACLWLVSCGSNYIPEKRGYGHIMVSEPFVSEATVDLENRGHSYKATPEKTWRAVHNVLRDMGVRVKRENRDWHMIDETYYATTPRREMSAFVNDLNRRRPERRVAAARYRLSIALNQEGRERTTVLVRVYPQIRREGSQEWLPVPSNKRVIEYFFRRLDRMLPAYRDDSLPMWQDW